MLLISGINPPDSRIALTACREAVFKITPKIGSFPLDCKTGAYCGLQRQIGRRSRPGGAVRAVRAELSVLSGRERILPFSLPAGRSEGAAGA